MTTDQGTNGGASPATSDPRVPSRRTPSAALARVFRFLTDRLRLGGRDGGEMEEVGLTATVAGGGGGGGSGSAGEDPTRKERQSKSRSQVSYVD